MIREHAGGNAVGIVVAYAYRGQCDETMRWFDRAYAQTDPFISCVRAENEPLMPTGDLRFKMFLRKMNMAE